MRILAISDDQNLLNLMQNKDSFPEDDFIIYKENPDPLDIISFVCSAKPSVVIVDDDFLRPESAHFISSIKKINKKAFTIFLTSDSSIELGREITPLGIHAYAVKPLDESEIKEIICSVSELKKKQTIN